MSFGRENLIEMAESNLSQRRDGVAELDEERQENQLSDGEGMVNDEEEMEEHDSIGREMRNSTQVGQINAGQWLETECEMVKVEVEPSDGTGIYSVEKRMTMSMMFGRWWYMIGAAVPLMEVVE